MKLKKKKDLSTPQKKSLASNVMKDVSGKDDLRQRNLENFENFGNSAHTMGLLEGVSPPKQEMRFSDKKANEVRSSGPAQLPRCKPTKPHKI